MSERFLRDLELVPIQVVPFDYVLRSILPPLRSGIDIKSIRSSLTASRTLTEDGQWAAFPVTPRNDGREEQAVFEGLQPVFTAIIEEARKTAERSPTVHLVKNPTKNNSSRPDAYLLMEDKKSVQSQSGDSQDSWDDIAVSLEFKKDKSRSERINNDQKLIWSLHHIMHNDPCRRSTFGVTIEDTEVRLWFTCRSVTVVAEAFDFVTDPDELIHLVCALAFADEEELGWDPTIQRVLVEGETRYDITFQEKEESPAVYRTIAIISDFGADAMMGKGTRVFKAYLKSRQGKAVSAPVEHVVIKDSWRDPDREREDQILQQVLEDVRTTQGADAAEDARKYFLTVLRGEDISINGRTDDTLCLLHGETVPDGCPWREVLLDRNSSRRPHVSSVGDMPDSPFRGVTPAPGSGMIQNKQHFRLVFDEVCQPIFEFKSLHDVLKTLLHAVAGLKYMHTAGWVHRDISVGNVLRHGDQGLITDLEYAKRTDSNQSYEVQTGTPDFMASEVESQSYHFLPILPISMDTFKGPKPAWPEQPPFRANSLHDLESLWWILMWVLHYHVDARTPALSLEQETLYQRHFPGLSLGPGQTRLASLMVNVEVCLLPAAFHSAALVANKLRCVLRNSYEKAEGYSGVDITQPYLESSKYFSLGLQLALEKQVDVRLISLHDAKKRKIAQELVEEKAAKRRKL